MSASSSDIVGPGVLPGQILSAAEAHLNLPDLRSRRFDALQCHIDGPRQPFPGGSDPLVSSHHGPLHAVLLTIPNYVLQEAQLAAIFRQLAVVLPEDTHLVVLTHCSAADEVRSWFVRPGHHACRECRFVEKPDDFGFTMWAEDAYVVGVTADGRRTLVDPALFERGADGLISSFVAAAAGVNRAASTLVFQGGNVLVGDDFYLIGADYLENSTYEVERRKSVVAANGEVPADLDVRIQRDFLDLSRQPHFIGCDREQPRDQGRDVEICDPNGNVIVAEEDIYRGNKLHTHQPIFHIDMFMTLVGRDRDGRFRVLVGDPRLAAEELGTKVPDHALADSFDEIAQNLERDHDWIVVERNPLPLVFAEGVSKKDGKYHRWWYYASANNAIVETRRGGRGHVWLPTFGYGRWSALERTDRMNHDIWKRHGFDVTMLPNCHPLAVNLGGLHCIKKYLAR